MHRLLREKRGASVLLVERRPPKLGNLARKAPGLLYSLGSDQAPKSTISGIPSPLGEE